jgi:hypothetical protein
MQVLCGKAVAVPRKISRSPWDNHIWVTAKNDLYQCESEAARRFSWGMTLVQPKKFSVLHRSSRVSFVAEPFFGLKYTPGCHMAQYHVIESKCFQLYLPYDQALRLKPFDLWNWREMQNLFPQLSVSKVLSSSGS